MNDGIKISNFDLRISELKVQFIEKNSENTRLKETLSDLSKSKERLLKETSIVDEQIVEAIELKEKKQENIENLRKNKELILAEVNKESELTKTFSEDIETYKNQVTSIKINLASKEERLKNINVEIERNKREKDSIINNINILEESLVKILEEKDVLIETVSSVSEKIREKIALKEKMEIEREKLLSVRLLSEKNISIKKRELENISKNIIDNKEALHKVEVNIAKYEVEKENVIKEIWDKYELSIIEALKFKKDDDFKDSIKEVRDIKKRISELGIVNLNAIEEYKEVKERYDFLLEQKTDLIKAQRSLRKVISELETLMKDQFINSFRVIKENFSTIFSDLFMGGKADLVIEDEENILNSDILILAQPLGKKLQDLTLMSGGEKALTAIALLFSILKAKPAPFCILDEIEAALDDVNVVRFAEFLKHFTMDSQFVVITHRKGTMDIADSIYGVTMEEHGVSKLVSVKLEDAI